MEKRYLKNCDACPHELIDGVACDWQPGDCFYHKIIGSQKVHRSHKHSAWAVNVADDGEYDAVRSFG